MKLFNPIAFRPLPVTFICAVVYTALLVSLLVVHHVVPQPEIIHGANLTEAWLDLQTLSKDFHPYNSRPNDEVRHWLLRRIKNILEEPRSVKAAPTFLFDDVTSNVTFCLDRTFTRSGASIYFEGTNILVYIRGIEDDAEDWWLNKEKPQGRGGVLLNAHYDSVSTGFGATDDGMGVVTILQLIRYFSTRQPRKGVVALLNNGEEDFLNGARVFSQHPMSNFPHTFLNLEGAGAGGRATLFRTTDTEVTRFYQGVKMPFGSVTSSDAFKTGIIRSETDYSFFNGFLGMRGLDVAFLEPRARYHSDEDDTKHTSEASLSHMMSAAFTTMQGLTSDKSSDFDNEEAIDQQEVSGTGSDAVWFDIFGTAFAVFKLDTLFAISITLLVVSPITLIAVWVALWKLDKLYLFSYSKHGRWTESDQSVGIKGLRGITRWPIAFILASAAVVGLAFLMTKANPYIIHSSLYAVWSMMISAWLVVAYVSVDLANFLRPTSLQRVYVLIWMFTADWVALIVVTRFEQTPRIASGYIMVFYFACVYLATMIAMLELFGLPRKRDFADDVLGAQSGPDSYAALLAPSGEESNQRIGEEEAVDEAEDTNETTSLLGRAGRTTFKRYSSPRRRGEEVTHAEPTEQETRLRRRIYGREQPWSATLPSSLWTLQLLFLAPIPLILVGQVALLFTSATSQTLADGNKPLPLYIVLAIFSILLFAPLAPFLHRLTYHIPTFLFLVFLGTLIYNMVAFPFSPSSRLKLYFFQRVDLDTGVNNVSLTGIGNGPYLLDAVTSLPSVAGQTPVCNPSLRVRDLTECSWAGLAPHVVQDPQLGYKDWLTFKARRHSSNDTISNGWKNPSRKPSLSKARFSVKGRDTRACKILFSQPVLDFHIVGESANPDPRFQRVAENGSKELRLWSRTWNRTWEIDVAWSEAETRGLNGSVVCLWSDANYNGVIPALDEAKKFAPRWVVLSKLQDGLVEGSKRFEI